MTSDWTDFWNFGAGSTAAEVKINQGTKARLFMADLLAATGEQSQAAVRDVIAKAWWNVNCFDEHTWGADNSLTVNHPQVQSQAHLKDNYAYLGREQAEYALLDGLEKLAQNPEMSMVQGVVLVVNPAPVKQEVAVPVPEWWRQAGKRHRTARFTTRQRLDQPAEAPLCGPFKMDPLSWRIIPLDKLKSMESSALVNHTEVDLSVDPGQMEVPDRSSDRCPENTIESPYYRLSYNPRTGRILSVVDKSTDREIVDKSSKWSFFQLIREYPDHLHDGERKALYNRAQEWENTDRSCWNPDWVARRESIDRFDGFEVEVLPDGVRLRLRYQMADMELVEQESP